MAQTASRSLTLTNPIKGTKFLMHMNGQVVSARSQVGLYPHGLRNNDDAEHGNDRFF
jgi:hypothetical protein